jgi:hypothetical protein
LGEIAFGVDVDSGGGDPEFGDLLRRIPLRPVRARNMPRSSYDIARAGKSSVEAAVDDAPDPPCVGGAWLLRNGKSKDSSMSSRTFSTAMLRQSGSGGSTVLSCEINSCRTSLGRLTSRAPFGRMYACISLYQRLRINTESSESGSKYPPDLLRALSKCRLYRCASMTNSNVSKQWFEERYAMNADSVHGGGAVFANNSLKFGLLG